MPSNQMEFPTNNSFIDTTNIRIWFGLEQKTFFPHNYAGISLFFEFIKSEKIELNVFILFNEWKGIALNFLYLKDTVAGMVT